MTLIRLFRILAPLPLWLLHALGWVLGWAVWLASPSYRRQWATQWRQAGIDPRAARASVGEAGKLVAELPRLWMGAPVASTWEDDGLVASLQARGRGILFLTPHLGCFEMAARAYAARFGHQGKPITVLYRSPRQDWLRPVVDRSRACEGMVTASTTLAGVKQLVKALREGGVVGLLPDQVPPLGLGVWVPYFGREAYTMTLAGRLAQTPNVEVLLVWCERLPLGRGYRVRVRALDAALPADPVQAAAAVNRAMESVVRACPHQYLWGYNRYKAPRKGY